MTVHLPLQKFDWFTLSLVIILCLVGIVMIFNASHIDALVQFGDKFRYARLQSLWLCLSLVVLGITLLIPLKTLKALSPYFMGLILISLILVLIPAFSSKLLGARRWLALGPLVIQPSELAKIALVLYLPWLLTIKNNLPTYLLTLGITIFLVLIEPDFGTAIILAGIGIGIYFLSGAPLKRLSLILLSGLIIAIFFILVSPYRLARVKTFLNPTVDPQGTSYHLRQVLIALGSGGFSGMGIGRSRQKFQYLPEATTDSIFAVIAEETGFIGASSLCLVFLILCLRMISTAAKLKDNYTQLVASGVLIWFALQITVNLASMVSLIPITGVPLPFISYGGSALISAIIGLGLFLNASGGSGLNSKVPVKRRSHGY